MRNKNPTGNRRRTGRAARNGIFGRATGLPMSPCPIPPDWIRHGRPTTRAVDHSRAVDGLAWTCIWDCTRSAFAWHYDIDETVLILEGEVRVTDANGRTHTLRAGDLGYFPARTTWFWEVDRYVRKVAFCRREVPLGLRLATRILARLHTSVHMAADRIAAGGAGRCWARLRGRSTTTALLLMSVPF